MYIDVALINDFLHRYPDELASILEDAIELCGVWYPALESVQAEWEDFDATLEEVCSVMYFIVEGNSMKFTNPDVFWEDLEKYMNGKMEEI